MEDNAGGINDVVCFAIRVALWNLQRGKKNNTIILDESFKFLSRDLQLQACQILKKLSAKLKLQFILVTHSPIMEKAADKLFRIVKIKGISNIKD